MAEHHTDKEVKELGAILLNVGALLMVSGASTARIRNTITRIATSFGYNADMLISQRTLMLSLYDEDNNYFFNSLKRTSPHGVNFTVLSGISKMSWQVLEEKWTVKQINEEVERLVALPHYSRWIVLVLVGLAGASFCRVAGGTTIDMLVVFIATFSGLFIRQETLKKGFNPYMCIYFASFTASFIAGPLVRLGTGHMQEHAFATSVLFLIPGVPLINSFSDMIEGNSQNGLIRGLNGFIISFAIALGMLTSMLL
ncbi:threonine/serine ThrE exporter family protein [Desertivirga arenae]|uniref:threonine/serine ThrE exporter family protein n=1 Tax=Desertivirga arenae TaxID=2810309 RepID=UPI001A976241|nr:threonine/serine exporter family protein [Pedobacter sp. SYSU D00823]